MEVRFLKVRVKNKPLPGVSLNISPSSFSVFLFRLFLFVGNGGGFRWVYILFETLEDDLAHGLAFLCGKKRVYDSCS